MASATVTTVPAVTTVTLTLDADEAQALAAVLSKVGGDPYKSDRGHTEAIAEALREHGINFVSWDDPGYPFESGGRTIFKDRADIG